jgi:hypothetical protein
MMIQSIPNGTRKFFWGDNLSELSWPKHKKYIIQTLLEKGDTFSLKWLFSLVTRKEIKGLLPNLRLEKKSKNFWSIYLA